MINSIDIGIYGEDLALKHFLNEGYTLLRKNYRTKQGEIDLILKLKDILCFVEVKTRYNNNFGTPGQCIDIKKKKRIIKASLIFIYSEKLLNYNVRYDVVEVVLNYKNDSYSINHIEGAFIQ
ncbi:YraN family protein [Clostridium thermarum]|uniref:YraN family protein n=1 Tax=Clostridium thermarum TaxID=1716543 RepID=UPI001120FA41|nr:YraN family protein [Clostridium thermarum]